MIPIPQYPLYSATISLLGAQEVGYYLNEDKGWEADLSDLTLSYNSAKAQGINPKILVVINPGNPTG